MPSVQTMGSEDLGIITVHGGLTFLAAGELQASVEQALRRFDRVVLSMEKTAEIDDECLAFLCRAHSSAVQVRKSLMIAGALASVVAETHGRASAGPAAG